MALFTPPPIPTGSAASGGGDKSKSPPPPPNGTPTTPVDPNRRYPNPSFGLSIWGPLVPASDCRECLYTLSFMQIAGGLFLWWVPAKDAFHQQPPPQAYYQPSPVATGSQHLPPSFTQYAPYNPQYRYTSPLSKAALWRSRLIRAASVFSGSYLIFLAGLELVRLQLPYDPWAEDATAARKRANDKLPGSQKASTWFGPRGYRPVEYREWKRRVDENLERRGLRFSWTASFGSNSTGSVPSDVLTGNGTGPANGTPQQQQKALSIQRQVISEIRGINRTRAHEILEYLKREPSADDDQGSQFYDDFTKEAGLANPAPANNVRFVGVERDPSTNRTKYSGRSSSPSPAGANSIDVRPVSEDRGVDNSPLTSDEEAELEALKPASPDEIDVELEVAEVWDRVWFDKALSFRPILHHLEPRARVLFQEFEDYEDALETGGEDDVLEDHEEVEEDENLFMEMVGREIKHQREVNPEAVVDHRLYTRILDNSFKRFAAELDKEQRRSEIINMWNSVKDKVTSGESEDGYDYYVPKNDEQKRAEEQDEDLDEDMKITFGKPADKAPKKDSK